MKMKHLLLIGLFLSTLPTMNGQAYKSAIGVKGGNVLMGTFKTFLGEKFAFEGVTGFGLGEVDADLYAAAYAEMHFPIGSLEKLTWFVGAGPNVATASAGISNNSTSWGLAGIGGVDFRIGDTPLNVSADISTPIFFGDTVLNFVPYFGASARYIFKDGGGSQ